MTKKEIAEHVVGNTTLTKSQAITAVDAIFGAITESLMNGKDVSIRGFGTFKAVTTKERNARNISKGTVVRVPARHTVKLILSKQLKSILNPSSK